MKLFIISRNNVSPKQWNHYLKTDEVFIWKCKNCANMIRMFHQFQPDAIIVDDYFRSEGDDKWMRSVMKRIRYSGFSQPIYCISPVYVTQETKWNTHGFDNVHTSVLGKWLLSELGRTISAAA